MKFTKFSFKSEAALMLLLGLCILLAGALVYLVLWLFK